MKIKDLPSGGNNFRVNIGPGSFSKKLSAATRAGGLKHLVDNKPEILKAVKHYEKAIRQGKFDYYRRKKAWKMVKKESDNLSKQDKKQIKTLFKHLSQKKEETKKEENKVKIQKQLAKDSSFKEERAKEMKEKISRFNKTRGGGESTLEFASQPEDKEKMSMSGKLLQRRFAQKEQKLKERLPRQRVVWEEEKEKRFEVSSLDRDMNKKPIDNKSDDNKETEKEDQENSYRPFQNL